MAKAEIVEFGCVSVIVTTDDDDDIVLKVFDGSHVVGGYINADNALKGIDSLKREIKRVTCKQKDGDKEA